MHEAGRAFDLSLDDLKIPLQEFWAIAAHWNVVPIISTPNSRQNEAWHFEKRGSHQKVHDYYKKGNGTNMKAPKAMAVSSILAIGVKVDDFAGKENVAYLQSCLIRLNYKLGNIDGIIGMKTRGALAEAGIKAGDLTDMITQVEDKVQEQYPEEFSIREIMKDDWFDYVIPDYIEG